MLCRMLLDPCFCLKCVCVRVKLFLKLLPKAMVGVIQENCGVQ